MPESRPRSFLLFLLRYPLLKCPFSQRIRYRLVLRCLTSKIEGKKVLDLGCGPGRLGQAVEAKRAQVIFFDLNRNYLKNIKGERVLGDATKLPFSNRAFDYLISTDVLEHIPPLKREALLYEMARTTKEKMVFTFSTLSKNSFGVKIFEVWFRIFKISYPEWYVEHNAFPVPTVNFVKKVCRESGLKILSLKSYYGVIGMMLKGSVTTFLTWLRQKFCRGRISSIIFFYIFHLVDFLAYFVFRLFDIPPYTSIRICATANNRRRD